MTIVIAEAGENHCGDPEMALKLVDMASEAGADYIKFQLFDADKATDDDPEKEWFHKVQISTEQFYGLVKHARDLGIQPLCTPWDPERAEVIFGAGIEDMKIASFHVVADDLLDYINGRARRVFMSTGMCTMDEIERAVARLDKVEELYVLHCVSEYPLVDEHANLRVIHTLREKFGHRAKIGYSDHTIGIVAPVAAVAMGAEVIEKHITLDHNLEGSDHILSANPEQLNQMVSQIRAVELMLGSPEKVLTPLEAEFQEYCRTSRRTSVTA